MRGAIYFGLCSSALVGLNTQLRGGLFDAWVAVIHSILISVALTILMLLIALLVWIGLLMAWTFLTF